MRVGSSDFDGEVGALHKAHNAQTNLKTKPDNLTEQVRLNVHARGEPISMVEFSHLDSPREACAVCALDMMANANNWQEAVKVVAKEIKKMAFFGLSVSALNRYVDICTHTHTHTHTHTQDGRLRLVGICLTLFIYILSLSVCLFLSLCLAVTLSLLLARSLARSL